MTRPPLSSASFVRQSAAAASLMLGSLACAQSHAASAAAAAPATLLRAEQDYLAGANLLSEQKFTEAEARFTSAAALDPSRPEYQLALSLTRSQQINSLVQRAAQARLARHPHEAETLLAEARKVDPQNEQVLQHDAAPRVTEPLAVITPADSTRIAPPIQLQPAAGPRNLHLRGDLRSVLSQAAAAYGIRTVFDDSVTPLNLRFDLDDGSYPDAMNILGQMGHVFATTLDPKTVLIAKDTQENRERFERQVQETIYIPASTVEQLNELSNIVKNVFDVKQVQVSPTAGTLLLRAPEPTLKAVNYTLADMLDGGSEVMLDLKLISVDKHISRNIGLTPPTQLNVFSAAAELQTFVTANQATIDTAISQGALVPTGTPFQMLVQEAAFLILSGLASNVNLTNILAFFGNGLTLFGVSLSSGGTFNLALNSSDARALDDLSVRVGDRQTTTLRVGEKYPITVSSYSSGITNATATALAGRTINGVSASSLLSQYLGGASAATIPQIQFEDLGITLKTTPTVQRSGLVGMHIELKIEALTGASVNDIPILTSRAYTSDITVKDGTTAVMLSDLSSTEAASVNGFPGFGSLPGFQETLSSKLRETDSSELILMVTPHLVRKHNTKLSSRPYIFRTSTPQDF